MSFVLRLTQGRGEYPLGPLTRHEVECQIEQLISVLDRLDSDPDAEDDGSGEPSLGFSVTSATGNQSDLELSEVAP